MRKTRNGAERVYTAAAAWVDSALRTDGSLFTPGETIWSRQWLEQLRRRFLDDPDESNANFGDKLQRQLEGSPVEVYQLMGEVLYFYFLIVSTTSSTNEQRVIEGVLELSPSPVAIPQQLAASLTPGLVNPGQYFHSGRLFQVGFLIEFAEQWKELGTNKQDWLLDNPWDFKEFTMGMNPRSALLRDNSNKPRIQREALLHLVFPNDFEAIVSVKHKEMIVKSFDEFVTVPDKDVDRKLVQIRRGLEAQGHSGNLWYEPAIRAQWKDNSKDEPPPPPAKDEPPPPQNPWSKDDIADFAEKLSWEPEQLQDIIDDLREKRQVIFYGPPGTGKTYVARTLARQCREYGGGFEIVQFHPSYSYEDFVQGFRPRLHGGQPGFDLVDGPLRRIAEQARATPEAPFILVIDELNRGNVAKVFGELYFLLEYRDEEVRLQYGGDSGGFSLPANLWFICTMNTADRSIALMDAALRRRFYFARFFPGEPPVKGLLRRWLGKHGRDTWVADLVDAANSKLDRDTGIGPSYFMGAADQTLDEGRVRRIWNRAVIPYIEEQCFGDDAKLREFDFDLLKRQMNSTTPTPDDGPVDGIGPANQADNATADTK